MTFNVIKSEPYRKFLENFESDLLRGIGKICILKIIKTYGKDGVHGYQILKDLKENTNNMVMIKEGTLYPILRNLESLELGENIFLIQSRKDEDKENKKKYYYLTDEGDKILSHMEGFFSKLIEGVASLSDFEIILNEDKYIFCANCKNKIDYSDPNTQFCERCGFKLSLED